MPAPAGDAPSAGDLWHQLADAAATEGEAEGAEFAPVADKAEPSKAGATAPLPAPTDEEPGDGEGGGEDDPEAGKGDKAAADAGTDKQAQLAALAQELGLVIDSKKVRHADWSKLRQANEAAQREIQRLRPAAEAQAAEILATAQEKIARAEAFDRACELGDVDGMAAASKRWKSWDEIQKHALQTLSDPNYRRMRDLEEKDAERERQRVATEGENQRRQAAEDQAARGRQYRTALVAEMGKSLEPVVSAFHDDPLFVSTVCKIQARNWDTATQTTISAEEALDWRPAPGAKTLREDLVALQNRLQRAGIAGSASPSQVPSEEIPRASAASRAADTPQAKPASNTRRKAAEAGAPVDPQDGKALIAAFGKRITEENAHADRQRRSTPNSA